MTNAQYEILFAALADKIAALETTIYLKDYDIDELKKKLAEAEGKETKAGVENE